MLLRRLIDEMPWLPAVRVAELAEDREAIYRMRYDVYVQEKNNSRRRDADHERREIRSPADDLPGSRLFYVGPPGAPDATLRVRAWRPGAIPADVYVRHSLERFSDIATRSVYIAEYFIARPTVRGTASTLLLLDGAIRRTILDYSAELMIADCPLGLVSAYCRLGLRPYGGRLINDTGKITVPLAGVVADLENLRRCRSPLYLTIWRLRAAGRLPTRDHSPLLVPFAESGIESNAARVREAMERSCARNGAPFLGRLPPRTRARLVALGQIVDIAPGMSIFDEGYRDRDLFVVLEGALELRVGGVARTTICAGEVLGEVAFARDSGHRSGAVRSVSQVRLLHLRHGALRRTLAQHPEDAIAFHAALSAVLAERLIDADARACRLSAGDRSADDAADLSIARA